MVDYAFNSDLDIYFNKWGDLETVEGRKEFEQDVVVTIKDEMQDIIQYGFTDTAREKIKLAVNRAAREHNQIDNIKNITIARSIDRSETFEVLITYETGDDFSELF